MSEVGSEWYCEDIMPLVLTTTYPRILHSQDPHLLHRMVGVVERLLECSDYQESVRLLGGIPLLLGLLRYICPHHVHDMHIAHTSHMCSKHVIGDAQSLTTQEKLLALRAVCCSALTQLVLNDANAQLIVQVSMP